MAQTTGTGRSCIEVRSKLRNAEGSGLRVLLVAIFVHHDHLYLVLSGRKPRRRRREGKRSGATARQFDRIFRPFFARGIFRNQPPLHLNFARRVTNRRDRVDGVVESEGTDFRIDAFVLSYLQAADVGCR